MPQLPFRGKYFVAIPWKLRDVVRAAWDEHHAATNGPPTMYKYLNAGIYVGYASAILQMAHEMNVWEHRSYTAACRNIRPCWSPQPLVFHFAGNDWLLCLSRFTLRVRTSLCPIPIKNEYWKEPVHPEIGTDLTRDIKIYYRIQIPIVRKGTF
jgi:hypothetical protein